MAKGGSSSQDMSDVSDLCDIKLLESAFRFIVKKGDDATLTDIKKIVDDKKVYDHIQVSAFSAHCDKKTKKMNWAKFKSNMWFEIMTKGDRAAAHALAKKITSNERTRQEKEAKGTTKGSDVTSRLTDTSKYTGAHKERFDESGQGKGSAGRTDEVNTSGYVGNYKGAGTFDKK